MMLELKRLDRNKSRIIGKIFIDGIPLYTKECGRRSLAEGEYLLTLGKNLPVIEGTGCFIITDNNRQHLYGDILIGFERSFDDLTQCASAMVKLKAYVKKQGDVILKIS